MRLKLHKMEEKIIEYVRTHPILYQKAFRWQRNAEQKEDLWKQLAEECGMDVQPIKTRWRSLRDRFLKEYKKCTGSSGFDGKDWQFYDMLTFLADTNSVSPRKKSRNSVYIKSPPTPAYDPEEKYFLENSSDAMDEYGFTEDTLPAPSPPKKKKISKVIDNDDISQKFSMFLNKVETVMSPTETSKDKHTPFFEMMRQKFDRMPESICEDFKMEILQLCHAKVKEFENSFD